MKEKADNKIKDEKKTKKTTAVSKTKETKSVEQKPKVKESEKKKEKIELLDIEPKKEKVVPEAKEEKKKKKFKKKNILSIIGIIMYIIFIALFIRLGVIPMDKVIIVAFVVLGLVYLLGIFLLNLKNKFIVIIGGIILVILIITNGVGIYFLYHTNVFLDKAFQSDKITSTSTYYVVTSKKSGLKANDIKGKVLYYESTKDIKKANKKLVKTYKKVKLEKSEDLNNMFKSVGDDTEHLMFIEKNYYDIVFKIDKKLNKDDYVILDKINIKIAIASQNVRNGNKFNIFLWGSDFTDVFMDFNMIVTINMNTNKILLTSIPRDYYIPVAGRSDGRRDTLSYMGPYGAETAIKSIEDYFKIKLDYYVYFNAKNVPKVIDTLGGIEYCVDEAYSVNKIKITSDEYKVLKDKIYINSGCQNISGIEAVSVVRPRKQFNGGDVKRQEYIRKVVIGVLKKVKDPNTVKNYSEIMDSLNDVYQTTLPRKKVTDLVKTTLKNKGNWEIKEQSINGQGGKDKVHLTDYVDWVMYPNEKEVKKASTTINKLLK